MDNMNQTIPQNTKTVKVLHERGTGDFAYTFGVEAGAELTLIDLQIGTGETQRTANITVELIGEGAKVNLLGLFIGKGSDDLKISHRVIHKAPRTISKLESRGLLTGSAFAHQTSSITIEPGQPGCSGDERADTILLSDKARVVAVPELEIGNNDVQCKHAVTTTRLNAEKLFYLTSRGLSEAEARKILIEAHLSPIMAQLSTELTDKLMTTLELLSN